MGRSLPYSLSPSSISAFKACPLAFRFSYLDRLPEPPSPAASKGTLVHRALELLLCRPPLDRTIDAALADLDRAHRELADDPEFAGLNLTDDERARFHGEAEVLVGKYFELEDPTTVRPIGLELKLQAEIGSVRLRGIIDRLELDADGGLVVTDYKTGGVPSERYEGKSLGGVHTYAMLCERMLGKRPAR
ncbi:MAG: PD-(D/E)XK nuclease family protein, partial [Thermoplasmata archaeon]|nr:PD-(D/E)XK nuclease family protein [Thermoplasmata archaeon]